MKKHILTLLFLTCSGLIFGQSVKKSTVKQTEIQKVKNDGLKWFKSSFVENRFKDPYSYKLLKADVYPVSLRESLESDIRTFENKIEINDTSKSYSEYKTELLSYNKDLAEHNNRFKNSDTTVKEYKNSLRYINYKHKEVGRLLKLYTDAVDGKKSAEERLRTTSPILLNKTLYYSVYVDCHSNNSYGNPVLGKYCFYYSKDGLVREPIQLNKDE